MACRFPGTESDTGYDQQKERIMDAHMLTAIPPSIQRHNRREGEEEEEAPRPPRRLPLLSHPLIL